MVVFLDQKRVLEIVKKEIRLEKLIRYGLSGTVQKLMKNYLLQRKQRVKNATNVRTNLSFSPCPNTKQGINFLALLSSFNSELQFTLEFGNNNLKFLDINMKITINKLEFDIFRNSTYTDTVPPRCC